jgi:phospholipid/cholesterol/gamma-HCH transport system substrate-binding protein
MSQALRLGVFVVVTLLIVAAGVFSVGSRTFVLRPTYSLKAEFQNVAGLEVGADVRVGGTRQGSVRGVMLPQSADGKVTVIVNLDSATRRIIKRDSVASINSEGLLGDKYVEISFGSSGAPPPKDGETIPSEAPRDISDLVKSAGKLLDSTNDTMSNIQSISSKVNGGEGTIGALINDRRLYEGARTATAKAADGAAAFADDMDAAKHNFLLRGFFKKRGYEDSSELTANAIPGLPAGAASQKFTFDGEQMFTSHDTAKLKNESKLKEVGRFLEKNGYGLAVVTDRTAHSGEANKSVELSQARAMVVRDYIAKNFKVDDTRLKTMGLGEANQAEDSKLEILVYPAGTPASAKRGTPPDSPAATKTANK